MSPAHADRPATTTTGPRTTDIVVVRVDPNDVLAVADNSAGPGATLDGGGAVPAGPGQQAPSTPGVPA